MSLRLVHRLATHIVAICSLTSLRYCVVAADGSVAKTDLGNSTVTTHKTGVDSSGISNSKSNCRPGPPTVAGKQFLRRRKKPTDLANQNPNDQKCTISITNYYRR